VQSYGDGHLAKQMHNKLCGMGGGGLLHPQVDETLVKVMYQQGCQLLACNKQRIHVPLIPERTSELHPTKPVSNQVSNDYGL
jgi:hypothetical protein